MGCRTRARVGYSISISAAALLTPLALTPDFCHDNQRFAVDTDPARPVPPCRAASIRTAARNDPVARTRARHRALARRSGDAVRSQPDTGARRADEARRGRPRRHLSAACHRRESDQRDLRVAGPLSAPRYRTGSGAHALAAARCRADRADRAVARDDCRAEETARPEEL